MRIKLLVPTFVLVVLTVAACGGGDNPTIGMPDDNMPMWDGHGDHDDTSSIADGARRIEMTASSFAFDPAELTARVGEDLAIVLTSTDVEHDFVIDEFDGHVVADVDETATGGFTAATAGRFTYYCSVPGHRDAGMTGTLVVE